MKASELRNAVLQLAIQGKLVPQDKNDEPASVLLKRIKEEKSKLIKQGKTSLSDVKYLVNMYNVRLQVVSFLQSLLHSQARRVCQQNH